MPEYFRGIRKYGAVGRGWSAATRLARSLLIPRCAHAYISATYSSSASSKFGSRARRYTIVVAISAARIAERYFAGSFFARRR